MALAIFDLDNTLLAGDSDHAFGDFLITQNLVDPILHRDQNDAFYQQYKNGGLDMVAYTEFAVSPIKGMERAKRDALHALFMQNFIEAMMLPASKALIAEHKSKGDFCLIMTATNRFVTEPIAHYLGVDGLIATELELVDDLYTGKLSGAPNFQDGKVQHLELWLKTRNVTGQTSLDLKGSTFYSDSFNDLPLLEYVETAIAVDPDDTLRKIAQERQWKIMSLR